MSKKKLFVSDLFTEFDLDNFSTKDDIENSVKLEYIKEMIAHAKSDKQAVFMYMALALGTIVFLIDKLHEFVQIPNYAYLVIFYAGILLLVISSVFFFTYWRKIHRCQVNIISCIPLLNIEKARSSWMGLWQTNNRYFKLGLLFLTIGMTLLVLIILLSGLVVQ